MNTWYTKSKAEDSQGLIIDETTGKNIAVSYDAKDAQLIATAPELLEALRELLALLEEHQGEAQWYTHGHYNHARAAITKATEGAV